MDKQDFNNALTFIQSILNNDLVPALNTLELSNSVPTETLNSIIALENLIIDNQNSLINAFPTMGGSSVSSFSGVRQTVQASRVDADGFPNFITASTGLSVSVLGSEVPIVINASGGSPLNDRSGLIIDDRTVGGLIANSTNYIYADIDVDGICLVSSTNVQPKYGFSKNAFLNIVPTMTSNTAPSGVVSASHLTGSYIPYLAFDGNTNIPTSAYLTYVSNLPIWLKYEFPSSVVIDSYSIYPMSTALYRSVRDWTFEGSNTGVFSGEQVVLDTQSGITSWVDYTPKRFSLSNNTAYKYYRIKITSAVENRAGDYVGLIELQLESFSALFSGCFFQISTMEMYIGDGVSSQKGFRVFLGEVSTNSSTVTNVICYALNGYYDTGDITTTAVSTSKNHNIGVFPVQHNLLLNGISQSIAVTQTNKSFTWTATAGRSRLIAKRGW